MEERREAPEPSRRSRNSMKTDLQDPVGDPRDGKWKRGVGAGQSQGSPGKGHPGLALPSPQFQLRPDAPVQQLG